MGIAILIPAFYVFLLAVGLRAATWIFNRVFPLKDTSGTSPSEETPSLASEPEYEATEAGPYTAPTAHLRVESIPFGQSIPEPSMAKGMGIGCVTVVGLFLVNVVLLYVMRLIPGTTPLKATTMLILFFGIGFLLHAALLSITLPTTYVRSLGVTLIVLLLLASLALVVSVPLWLMAAF